MFVCGGVIYEITKHDLSTNDGTVSYIISDDNKVAYKIQKKSQMSIDIPSKTKKRDKRMAHVHLRRLHKL